MRYLILAGIKLYWIYIPKSKRRNCIFQESCSKHVFKRTLEKGFKEGLNALLFRYRNCRYGFEIFENPINGKTQMILPNKQIINESEIAERLLKTNRISEKAIS